MNRQQRRGILAEAKRRGSWEWENRLVAPHRQLKSWVTLKDMLAAWVNDHYSVQVYEVRTNIGDVIQLVIRRHDGRTIEAWADLQRIKNELVGEGRTAVQMYPAMADLVDQANLYHLWVLPDGYELPFGLHFKGGCGFR